MDRAEYRTVYLRSEHWQATRKVALEAAGHRCQVCNGAQRLDVHHRTYANVGKEQPGDLTVLCRGCHDLYHGTKQTKPKKVTLPSAPRPKQKKKAKRTPAQERNTKRQGKQQKHREHIAEQKRKAASRRIEQMSTEERAQQARYEQQREERRQARELAAIRIAADRAARAQLLAERRAM